MAMVKQMEELVLYARIVIYFLEDATIQISVNAASEAGATLEVRT
jgi:hypothetical protein